MTDRRASLYDRYAQLCAGLGAWGAVLIGAAVSATGGLLAALGLWPTSLEAQTTAVSGTGTLAQDGSDAMISRIIEGAVDWLMVGMTFALILVAISSFKIQTEIAKSRAEAQKVVDDAKKAAQEMRDTLEAELEAFRVERERFRTFLSFMPGSYQRMQDVIGALPAHLNIEDAATQEKLRGDQMQLVWERKFLDLTMLENDPDRAVSECRDIIGSMQNQQSAVPHHQITDHIRARLREIIALEAADGPAGDATRDLQDDAVTLLKMLNDLLRKRSG